MFLLEKFAPLASVLVAFIAVTFHPSAAAASGQVKLDILVIEAMKTGKSPMPAKLKEMKLDDDLADFGFTSIRIVDQLEAQVQADGSVSLEIASDANRKQKKQMLKVKVLEQKGNLIRLNVALPSMKFEADTDHTNGAALLLAASKNDKRTLFLAIRPRP